MLNMDETKSKSGSLNRRSKRSKSSYSDNGDDIKKKRKRSNSFKLESDDGRSRSKQRYESRSRSRSKSYSESIVSPYQRSYRSRSISRTPDNLRHRKSKHHRRSRSFSNSSSKGSRPNSVEASHSKEWKKVKDPRDKSKREIWKNKVYIVGEIMKDCVLHFCDTCQLPIFLYCRLIPCKHIFCFSCGAKHQDKKCPRCDKKVSQIEKCSFGSIFMCYQGGLPHGTQGCRRTYLSQRDLDSHINHRHNKAPTAISQPNTNPCNMMSMPTSNPLGMLTPNFLNSFSNQLQQQQLQSLLHQQQIPLNQLQSQHLVNMTHPPGPHMMQSMSNMLAGINGQPMSCNQPPLGHNPSQMNNQNFPLTMPPMNMMPCNINQNPMQMINQTNQNLNSVLNNPSNNPVPQLVTNNNMVQPNMFMSGTGNGNSANPLLMGGGNPGFSNTGPSPLMAQLTNIIQGMSHQQQQNQSNRSFHDMPRQLQRPSSWSGQSSQGPQLSNTGTNNP